MNIGIMGAGNIGATLARKLVTVGHSVRIANSRGPETPISVAELTGAPPMTMREVTRRVEVIILSTQRGSIMTKLSLHRDQLATADVVRLNRSQGA